jgi:hypothetical protein
LGDDEIRRHEPEKIGDVGVVNALFFLFSARLPHIRT